MSAAFREKITAALDAGDASFTGEARRLAERVLDHISAIRASYRVDTNEYAEVVPLWHAATHLTSALDRREREARVRGEALVRRNAEIIAANDAADAAKSEGQPS